MKNKNNNGKLLKPEVEMMQAMFKVLQRLGFATCAEHRWIPYTGNLPIALRRNLCPHCGTKAGLTAGRGKPGSRRAQPQDDGEEPMTDGVLNKGAPPATRGARTLHCFELIAPSGRVWSTSTSGLPTEPDG